MLQNSVTHNLSHSKLPPTDLQILSFGTKFIPRQSLFSSHLLSLIPPPIERLKRNLLINLYFNNDSTTITNIIPKQPSSWTPTMDIHTHRCVDHLIKGIEVKMKSFFKNARCYNTSSDRFIINRLNNILHRDDIIIKPSDKNLGLTILDKDHYVKLCLSHLNETTQYKKLPSYSPNKTFNDLKQLLMALNEFNERNSSKMTKLASSLLQLMNKRELRVSPFYILPKLHKQPISSRPIVSAPSTATYHASVYLNNIFRQLLKFYPQICNSHHEVLQARKDFNTKELDNNHVIVTADVKSLYPSIPIDDGITTIKQILQRHQQQMGWTDKFVNTTIHLLSFVLKNNICEFQNEHYLQLEGTAMGTPCAPTFANLYLTKHDTAGLMDKNIPIYYRYIDDIFGICGNVNTALDFLEDFQDNNIQLDAISVKRRGIFLDLELWLDENNKLQHQLYQKQQNLYQYLPATSSHNHHIFKNFIKNELVRYRRCCTMDEDFSRIKSAFMERLSARGYQLSYLISIFHESETEMRNLPTQVSHQQPSTPRVYQLQQRDQKILNFVVNIPFYVTPKINWNWLLKIPLDLVKDLPELERFKIRPVVKNQPNLGKLILRSSLSK